MNTSKVSMFLANPSQNCCRTSGFMSPRKVTSATSKAVCCPSWYVASDACVSGISSAPRGVQVEELGFCSAWGWAPIACVRAATASFFRAGPLRRFFRALLGLDFPDPDMGQIWRSEHSGQRFRVAQVSSSEWRGTTTVRISLEFDAEGGALWSPVLCTYATTLAQWRANLRMERRVLVKGEEGGHG